LVVGPIFQGGVPETIRDPMTALTRYGGVSAAMLPTVQ